MFLMNEETSNGSWARVEVLVGTPGSHIHTPVMEVKLNVASCMGQVKTNIATLRERRERERGEREGGGEGGRKKERDVDTRQTMVTHSIYRANNVILCSS